MFYKRPKIYAARAMSGEDQAQVVAQARADKEFFEKWGIEVLCPVLKEKVKAIRKPLRASKDHMDVYWPTDKQMIREANVLVNFSPNKPSLGVIREHGRARYYHWKKVVAVFPEGQLPIDGAVCYYEDDSVVDSRIGAVESILRTHGTYWLRLKWRLKMLNEHLLHFLSDQLLELFR